MGRTWRASAKRLVSVQTRPGHSITVNDERRITAFDGLAALSSNTAFATLSEGQSMSVRTVRQAPPSIGEQSEINRRNAQAARERNQRLAALIGSPEKIVADAFEGRCEIVNVGAATSWQDAEAQIVAAIQRESGMTLSTRLQNEIGEECCLYWNRRLSMRKALLAQTQQALANPFFSIGAR